MVKNIVQLKPGFLTAYLQQKELTRDQSGPLLLAPVGILYLKSELFQKSQRTDTLYCAASSST